jgi:hydroxymethylpyrimidine pyrophosphatase-like HAD family hydrolase
MTYARIGCFSTENIKSKLVSSYLIDDTEKDIIDNIVKKQTLILLYGKWGKPAAIDMESKMSEAGLANTQLVDYRNFAHGRHNWVDKNLHSTAIVCFATPEDTEFIEVLESTLPSDIPILKVFEKENSPISTINMTIKGFFLTHMFGKNKNIDPGRPNVPEYGSIIYNHKPTLNGPIAHLNHVLLRKYKNNLFLLNSFEDHITGKLETFVNKINNTTYSSIVFDYDGTICPPSMRFEGAHPLIIEKFIILLSNSITIGIATGRGKSVRKDLQKVIPEKYWDQILIGYYNGSQIAMLSNNNSPNKSLTTHKDISILCELLKSDTILFQYLEIESSPNQIEIKTTDYHLFDYLYDSILEIVSKNKLTNLKVLRSSHSLDIISSETTKLSVVQKCAKDGSSQVLCIGDKGSFPGNDFFLLSSDYSLSVDDVSTSLDTGWNLASKSKLGVDATIEYLNCINILHDGSFKITLPKSWAY